MPKWLINTLLVAAVVAIFGVAFWLGGRATAPDEEGFAGTDSQATEHLEEQGYEPWFGPLFEPSSGEIESGLFALQAGLGGAVLGFALGALWRGRRISRADGRDEVAGDGRTASGATTAGPDHPPATRNERDDDGHTRDGVDTVDSARAGVGAVDRRDTPSGPEADSSGERSS